MAADGEESLPKYNEEDWRAMDSSHSEYLFYIGQATLATVMIVATIQVMDKADKH